MTCVSLYMASLCAYYINTKYVPWDESLIYHWTTTLWFIRFDKYAKTIRKKQRSTVTDSIAMDFLFPRYDVQNPRGATTDPCEHTFGGILRVEREFKTYCLIQLVENYIGRKEICTRATLKSSDHRLFQKATKLHMMIFFRQQQNAVCAEDIQGYLLSTITPLALTKCGQQHIMYSTRCMSRCAPSWSYLVLQSQTRGCLHFFGAMVARTN